MPDILESLNLDTSLVPFIGAVSLAVLLVIYSVFQLLKRKSGGRPIVLPQLPDVTSAAAAEEAAKAAKKARRSETATGASASAVANGSSGQAPTGDANASAMAQAALAEPVTPAESLANLPHDLELQLRLAGRGEPEPPTSELTLEQKKRKQAWTSLGDFTVTVGRGWRGQMVTTPQPRPAIVAAVAAEVSPAPVADLATEAATDLDLDEAQLIEPAAIEDDGGPEFAASEEIGWEGATEEADEPAADVSDQPVAETEDTAPDIDLTRTLSELAEEQPAELEADEAEPALALLMDDVAGGEVDEEVDDEVAEIATPEDLVSDVDEAVAEIAAPEDVEVAPEQEWPAEEVAEPLVAVEAEPEPAALDKASEPAQFIQDDVFESLITPATPAAAVTDAPVEQPSSPEPATSVLMDEFDAAAERPVALDEGWSSVGIEYEVAVETGRQHLESQPAAQADEEPRAEEAVAIEWTPTAATPPPALSEPDDVGADDEKAETPSAASLIMWQTPQSEKPQVRSAAPEPEAPVTASTSRSIVEKDRDILESVFGYKPGQGYDAEEFTAINRRRNTELLRLAKVISNLAELDDESLSLLDAVSAMRGLPTVALARIKAGRYEEATATAIKAIAASRLVESITVDNWYEESRPDPTRLWYMLAEIYSARGDGERAHLALDETERSAKTHDSISKWDEIIEAGRALFTSRGQSEAA